MQVDNLHNLQMSMNQNASASNNQTGYIAWQDVPVNAPVGRDTFPTYGANYFTLNGTVVTTVMKAAPPGYVREVTHFSLVNNDNATDQLIVQTTLVSNSSNNQAIYKATQLTLANWVYERGVGWKNQSAAGLSL
jgi:hypothetical protein